MTGARAAVDDGTPTEVRHRIVAAATTIGPWLPPGELGEVLADGLARVEAVLSTSVDSEHGFVREAAGHLMAAGGKRFRPMLALLAAQLGGGAVPDVVRAAVVCELTHLATLYHDDVMDEAAVRRGAPSANSRWGNSVAILVGDLLFARASDLLADLEPEAVRIQAQTFERLVGGQITDDGEHAEALALLRSSASLRRANEVLQEYADRARQRLSAVPDGEVRTALSALCDYVVTRTS